MTFIRKFYICFLYIIGILIFTLLLSGFNSVSADDLQASTQTTSVTQAATTRKSVKIKSVKVKKLTATVKWKKLSGAEKYDVFLYNNNKWKKVKTTSALSCTLKNLENGRTYYVRVRAVYNTDQVVDYSYFSENLEFKTNVTKLYRLNNAKLFNNKKKVKRKNVSGLYTGYESNKYKGYVVINYNYNIYLVKKASVSAVKGAVVLSTAAVSQINGKYAGYSACGPTAVAILLNCEKNTNINKDELIKYTNKHKLNDQGSLTSKTGGITSSNLIKLIKAYGYNASNVYKSSSKPSTVIKKQINSGKRVIALVKYSGGIQCENGAAHFVVICGYKYINGKLYFYYADPFYSSGGGRSLLSVSAARLNKSMSSSFSEPNTILVLD